MARKSQRPMNLILAFIFVNQHFFIKHVEKSKIIFSINALTRKKYTACKDEMQKLLQQ